MFKNKVIIDNQHEPDSSPEAWKHYKKYYIGKNCLRNNYNLDDLNYYTYINGRGIYVNVINSEIKNNRLYALHISTIISEENGIKCFKATRRVAGECDFNFNDKKYNLFKKLINNDNQALEQLDYCKKMHHTLLNFSLIEAMGNLQGIKGKNKFDRLDYFVYILDQYYKGLSCEVLSKATYHNKPFLIEFLSEFNDIYDYCKQVYFIEKDLVDKIIKNGKEPIVDLSGVVNYMNLAKEFWEAKRMYFLNK